MIRGKQPTEEMFLKDISIHEMTVLLDNGVYRHLRFRQPKRYDMAFDIVTYPGHLVYSGDMGCYVFSRLNDMFEFFRTDSKKDGLGINLSYWGEKLEAVDRNGKDGTFKEFSEYIFKKNVEDHIEEWIERFDGTDKKEFESELRGAIEEEVYDCLYDGYIRAVDALNDFVFEYEDEKYHFSDTWEWNCDDYTFRFVWCCYALAWSIQKYDAQQTKIEVFA